MIEDIIESMIDTIKLIAEMAFFLFIILIIAVLVVALGSSIEEAADSNACIKSGALIEVVSYYDKELKMCVDKLPNGKNRLRYLGRNLHSMQAYPVYTPIIIPHA